MQKRILAIFLIFYSIICSSQNAPKDSLKAILETAGDDTSKVNILLAMSKSYFGTDPGEAVKVGMLAKELAERINYTKGVALALKNTGLAYYKQGKYVEALNDWNESKKIFE